MGKATKKKTLTDKKKLKMGSKYRGGGGDSRYARKRKYLARRGLWGWEVPEPKPWKRASSTQKVTS